MFRFNLSPDDLNRVRPTYSPFLEVISALGAASRSRVPVGPAKQRELLTAAQRTAHRPEAMFFSDWLPDFLVLPPDDPGETFERSLDRAMACPDEVIAYEVQCVADAWPHRREAVLGIWGKQPHERLERLCLALRKLWTDTFHEAWPAFEALHQGELARLGLLLAMQGPLAVLDELRPAAKVNSSTLDFPGSGMFEVAPAGAGIVLLASVFAPNRHMVGVGRDGAGLVIRPPSGRALLWSDPSFWERDPAGQLIGHARAAILRMLALPRATTDLARLLDIPPNTVSYHLARLREAGFVTSVRSGRRVYYRLTSVGERFLDLWRTGDVKGATELSEINRLS